MPLQREGAHGRTDSSAAASDGGSGGNSLARSESAIMRMRFLFASDFTRDWNSGSAGTILAIGTALGKRGHVIDYLWQEPQTGGRKHPSLDRLLDLPQRQLRQVRQQLSG